MYAGSMLADFSLFCFFVFSHFHLISMDFNGFEWIRIIIHHRDVESQRCQALARPEDLLCFGWESQYENLPIVLYFLQDFTADVFLDKVFFLRRYNDLFNIVKAAKATGHQQIQATENL